MKANDSKNTQPTITPLITTDETRREAIRKKALSAVSSAFPIIGSRTTLELVNPSITEKTFSSAEQKKALLEGKSIVEPLRGYLVLKDNRTGKILDKTKTTLAHLPWFTPRHSFIIDGNEYSVANQLRLRPGVYTRVRANQELEAQFNLSRGSNFKVDMVPDTGVFTMHLGGSSIPLYGVLSTLGISHENMVKRWGPRLTEINKAAWSRGRKDKISFLFKKLFPSHRGELSTEEKIKKIQEYYKDTRIDPEVTKHTLGKGYASVDGNALLDSSTKLLSVFNKEQEPDDRDSLRFKTIHQADDLLAERIKLDTRSIVPKLRQRLDHTPEHKVKRIVSVSPFTKGIKTFLTTSSLAKRPTQYNPIEILDGAQRVTSLGEGGIENSRAVTAGARTVHPSHFGVIDPIVTSESPTLVGVDARLTFGAGKDEHGNIYTTLINRKTGKPEFVPVEKAIDARVAFPKQKKRMERGKPVAVMYRGNTVAVNPKDVDYRVGSSLAVHGVTANLLPFMNSMQGNRALMAAKHITQALPLVEKESPLVQVASPSSDTANEYLFGRMMVPKSPVDGIVKKIDNDYIYIVPTKGGSKTAARNTVVKIPYDSNYPLATKTYLHNTLTVSPGDRVKSGDMLADSNITKNGTLAFGRNLNVALMAYKGLNSNDAVVVSASAAKKLTSSHMYKESLFPTPDTKVSKEIHQAQFGSKYQRSSYDKLSSNGVVKKGAKVMPGDILIAAVEKSAPTVNMSMLGKLHRSLMRPFRDTAVTWEHDNPGEVVDVYHSSRRVMVTVKTDEPVKLGDKLSGRHGNKGVVSEIIPDDRMPRDESGNPIDVMLTSAGVVSRINPSQVLEMAAGKVAKKTGKPILIPGYSTKNNVKEVKKLLNKHGISDKETVFDPESGKKIPNIMVGPQYIMKLMKTTDTNFSARGIESYDVNQQPSKGGTTGAKAFGMMEASALLSHGAKAILKDATTVRGQRNSEYWQRVRRGLPPSPVKTSFAYDKFGSMLTAAGVKFDKDKDILRITPLTDRDVKNMSSGEINNPLLLRAADLKAEKGGLFDPVITGGLNGTKWGHIKLNDRVVNPVFFEPARRLLGVTQAELKQLNETKGGEYIARKLNSIDLKAREKKLLRDTKTLKGAGLDAAVKELKYTRALKKVGLKPGDAYTLKHIPVLPPVMRPVIPSKSGSVMVNDANYLYRDVMLANQAHKDSEELTPDIKRKAKEHLQDSVGALFGFNDPVSPQAASKNARGFISIIAGKNPKEGFVQSKLLSKRLDLSGRGTVIPDIHLNMDQLGIPEDMGWAMYEPFIMGRLVKNGYPAVQAEKMVKEKHLAAREELKKEISQRPVLWNRAPTLHRFNIISAYPKLIPGKSIRIPATWPEVGMAMDYDGDAVQVHVPATPEAVNEAKRLTLPNLLFSDKIKTALLVKPQHEAIYGLNKLQEVSKKPGGRRVNIKNVDDALDAYQRGTLNINDKVS